MKTPTKRGHIGSPQGKLTPCSLFATPPRVAPSSPLKSPLKSPAFQRYQALVTEGRYAEQTIVFNWPKHCIRLNAYNNLTFIRSSKLEILKLPLFEDPFNC